MTFHCVVEGFGVRRADEDPVMIFPVEAVEYAIAARPFRAASAHM
jgi:hypothetical protein